MLSDSCSEFGWVIQDAIKEAAKTLLEDVERYSKHPFDYPPEQIQALREAATAVLANREDKQLGRKLMTLAEAVRAHHDDSTGQTPWDRDGA
jgi:GTP cyclohydrolase III